MKKFLSITTKLFTIIALPAVLVAATWQVAHSHYKNLIENYKTLNQIKESEFNLHTRQMEDLSNKDPLKKPINLDPSLEPFRGLLELINSRTESRSRSVDQIENYYLGGKLAFPLGLNKQDWILIYIPSFTVKGFDPDSKKRFPAEIFRNRFLSELTDFYVVLPANFLNLDLRSKLNIDFKVTGDLEIVPRGKSCELFLEIQNNVAELGCSETIQFSMNDRSRDIDRKFAILAKRFKAHTSPEKNSSKP